MTPILHKCTKFYLVVGVMGVMKPSSLRCDCCSRRGLNGKDLFKVNHYCVATPEELVKKFGGDRPINKVWGSSFAADILPHDLCAEIES